MRLPGNRPSMGSVCVCVGRGMGVNRVLELHLAGRHQRQLSVFQATCRSAKRQGQWYTVSEFDDLQSLLKCFLWPGSTCVVLVCSVSDGKWCVLHNFVFLYRACMHIIHQNKHTHTHNVLPAAATDAVLR